MAVQKPVKIGGLLLGSASEIPVVPPVSESGGPLKRPPLSTTKKVMASGMSEAEAIQRAQQGDGHSFAALYSFHKRRVYSLCLRMTGNTAEAEDLTQEAFLQLYRKIATF